MGAILSRNRESRDYSRNLRSIPDIIQLRNVCCKCNVQFETKKNLDEHMQRVHAGTFYMCNYCNLIIKNWSLFKHHIYLYHNDVVFCSYCYKAFTDYLSLHLHWKMHGKYRYLCVRANNSYKSNICII